MNWINVKEKIPQIEGKYIVKTITPKGNINRFECDYHLVDDKPKFRVSNQIITHWLNEIKIEL